MEVKGPGLREAPFVYSGIACLGEGVKNACHLFNGNLFYFHRVTCINLSQIFLQNIPQQTTYILPLPIHDSNISNFDAQLMDESLCFNLPFQVVHKYVICIIHDQRKYLLRGNTGK